MALSSVTHQRERDRFEENSEGNTATRAIVDPEQITTLTDKQDDVITELETLNSLIPSAYDYISLSYTSGDLTGAIFKTGGSGGTTISTITLAYTDGNLTSVVKT